MNVVESLFEDDCKKLCGCQVAMRRSPVRDSVANWHTENAIQGVQGQRSTKGTDGRGRRRKMATDLFSWWSRALRRPLGL